MGAAHVVGNDLQLRFCVDPCPLREEQIAAEDDVLIGGEVMQNGVVTEEETIVEEDESAAEETPLQRSFAAAPVPAPPISTPRSLRRWLPRREDDAFPKAS